MKGQVNDGGPAFPVTETAREERRLRYDHSIRDIQHQGLSLRAYAAIAALPEVIRLGASTFRNENDAARIALDYADALLEALDA